MPATSSPRTRRCRQGSTVSLPNWWSSTSRTMPPMTLHISLRELLALGRENASDESEPFNMAYLAVRGCAAVNGVSRLHGEVSRRIFQPLFPRRPAARSPDRPRDQRRSHAELGQSGGGRAMDQLLRQGSLARIARIRGRADSRARPTPTIWQCRTIRPQLARRLRPRAVVGATCRFGRHCRVRSKRAKHLFNPRRAHAWALRADSRPTSGRICCCAIRSGWLAC